MAVVAECVVSGVRERQTLSRGENRFGVNADALRICGLSLGTPERSGGQMFRRPQVGEGRGGGLLLGEKRKEEGGCLGRRTGPLAYQCCDWGPAPVSLWSPSWGHGEGTSISTAMSGGGERPRGAGKPTRPQRAMSLLQSEPGRGLSLPTSLLP